MCTAFITLLLTFASQAAADCGNLCDYYWWKTATTANVQAELSGGADVMARNLAPRLLVDYGSTPLHWAATFGNSSKIQALLAAGADAKAKDKNGETPWDLAQKNKIRNKTEGYWALNDAQYN